MGIKWGGKITISDGLPNSLRDKVPSAGSSATRIPYDVRRGQASRKGEGGHAKVRGEEVAVMQRHLLGIRPAGHW